MDQPAALAYSEETRDLHTHRTIAACIQFLCTVVSKLLMPVFWATIKVTSDAPLTRNGQGTLIIANHKSYYDPLIIANAFPLFSSLRPIRFIAKDELFFSKLSRWFFTLAGCFPVYYRSGLENSLRIPTKLLEKGETVLFFPEGRCVREERLGEGKIGAAVLAAKIANIRILPMAITNAYRIKWRFLKLPIVRVHFGKPFVPSERFDLASMTPEALIQQFMQDIQNLYNTIKDAPAQ